MPTTFPAAGESSRFRSIQRHTDKGTGRADSAGGRGPGHSRHHHNNGNPLDSGASVAYV